MRKTIATIIKEWTLLRRDVAGLIMLVLMPAVLLVVMAMIQDAPFRDYQELRFDLLLADNDKGSLGDEIRKGLKSSPNFHVIDSVDGQPLSEEQLKKWLQQGRYRVGIVIPKGATAEIANAANKVANNLSRRLGLGTLPEREVRDSLYVRMYFDPAAKPTFRMSLSFALDKYVTYSCSNVLVQRLSKLEALSGDSTHRIAEQEEGEDFKKIFGGIGVREVNLDDRKVENLSINSVQHNVPAWAIFGMFFIVVPIAGHMIREREERSAMRLSLIPGAAVPVALGRVLCYLLVCMVQFAIMLCIGFWLLPLLDLPRLQLGAHPWALLPVVFFIALAATSYGFFIGSVFRTTNQAMPFGAISVVILSAMGGIWVPLDILPGIMQRIAWLSPLHWGLDAVNQLFLRNRGLNAVGLQLLILGLFSVVMIGIGLYRNHVRPKGI